ncbi:D-aminoacyl-tRNA deacylase [Candidatus Omnitrophota bacterium]
MKTVIQRVKEASVIIEGKTNGSIQNGLVVFICVEHNDSHSHADYLVDKLLTLRIFNDADGKMNRSIQEAKGAFLVISQFTLSADCKKGRRPSFDSSAKPEKAQSLYNYFIQKLQEGSLPVASGVFGAMMNVHLINDGPVTFILNSI